MEEQFIINEDIESLKRVSFNANRAIRIAINNDSLKAVNYVLELGPDLSLPYPPLAISIDRYKRQYNEIKKILDRTGDFRTFKLSIEAGEPINYPRNNEVNRMIAKLRVIYNIFESILVRVKDLDIVYQTTMYFKKVNTTYLTQTVSNSLTLLTEKLLHQGANINFYYRGPVLPVTSVSSGSMLNMLPVGTYFDAVDSSGNTLLSSLVRKSFKNEKLFFLISSLLKTRNVNVNIPPQSLPLMIAVAATRREETFYYAIKVIDLLIDFGAYPSAMSVNRNRIKTTTTPLAYAKEYCKSEVVQKLENVNKIYNLTYEQVCSELSKGANSKLLIQRVKDIAQKAQIPLAKGFGESKASINSVCSCLNFIKQNKENFDYAKAYEAIYTLRKKKRKCAEGNEKYASISDSSLLFLNEGGRCFCFDKSQLRDLLSTGKNPYTGKELPQNFITEATTKKLSDPESLQESLDSLFPEVKKVETVTGDLIQRCIKYYKLLKTQS